MFTFSEIPSTATSHPGEPRADRNDNDIDRFMDRVLAKRNAAPWRRLGDFVLRETWSFELAAPPESRLSSFRRVREYEWYVRDGTAVRSPVRVDGVGIDDAPRRDYERSWLREEERRRAGLPTGEKYSFGNAGLDFLRFRWLLRADGLHAVMELAPVRGVWMPARMTLSGRATTALGEYEATITQKFLGYRQADTGARLAEPESDR